MILVYARISPRPDQDSVPDPTSIRKQINSCIRYTRNYLEPQPVKVVYDRYISARTQPLYRRQYGAKLEQWIETGKATAIVTAKLDRLFRNTADGLLTLNDWSERGVKLYLADEGGCTVNCDTAVGEMITTALLMCARFEPRQTAERITSTMRYLSANGKIMSKHPPRGFMRDPEDPSSYIIDPKQQEAIEKAREMHSHGEKKAAIVRKLAAAGYQGPSGKPITREYFRGIL